MKINSQISVVIPVFNEDGNLNKLLEEVISAMKSFTKYEIIFINDGSTDKSLKILQQFSIKKNIKVISNKKNMGQSYSLYTGIKNSNFLNIVTLDADLQNNPSDIVKLSKLYFSNNFSLVGGIRKKRIDKISKIVSSKIANYVRMKILNDHCKDTGCSLKIFNKEAFLSFPYFDGIHRFLPAFFSGYGFKTYYVDVDHRHRYSGYSKYDNFKRLFQGIRDLYKVYKILKKRKKKL